MSVSLDSESGEERSLGYGGWWFVTELARSYGWDHPDLALEADPVAGLGVREYLAFDRAQAAEFADALERAAGADDLAEAVRSLGPLTAGWATEAVGVYVARLRDLAAFARAGAFRAG